MSNGVKGGNAERKKKLAKEGAYINKSLTTLGRLVRLIRERNC
jgi:hypothetical protein